MKIAILIMSLLVSLTYAKELVQEAKGAYTINTVGEPTNKDRENAVAQAILSAKAKAVEKIGTLITVTREVSNSNESSRVQSKRNIMSASSAVVKHYLIDTQWVGKDKRTVVVTIKAYVSEEKVDDILKRSVKNLEEMREIAKENERILTELKRTQKELMENRQKLKYKKISMEAAAKRERVIKKDASSLLKEYDALSKKLIVVLEKGYVKKSLYKTKVKFNKTEKKVHNLISKKIYENYLDHTSVSVSNVEFFEMEDGRIKMYFDLRIANNVGHNGEVGLDRKAIKRSGVGKYLKIGLSGEIEWLGVQYYEIPSNEIKQRIAKYATENGIAVVMDIGGERFYGPVLAYGNKESYGTQTYLYFPKLIIKRMQIVTTKEVIDKANGQFEVGPEILGDRMISVGMVNKSYIGKSKVGRSEMRTNKLMEDAKY